MTYRSIFPAGPRLIDGTALNAALANPSLDYKAGVTATAAGTQTSSIVVQNALTQFSTVASGAGCTLPYATAGAIVTIINGGANNLTVFAAAGPAGATATAIINAAGSSTAGATGVTLGNGRNADFYCAVPGVWVMALGASS